MDFGIRKNLSRNMYLSNQNQAIEDEIKRLRQMSAFDINAQNKINELEKQKTQNYQTMASPITKQETLQYDDYGHFVGEQQNNGIQNAPNNGGILQTVQDGISHAASGISQGFFDEANGVIGGAGRVMANAAMRAFGQPVNGESISDAWNKGYTEYRDYARQELADGAERNPGVSLAGEVVGSLASPIKVANTNKRWLLHPEKIINARKTNALANGTISGIGYTDNENASVGDYAANVAFGVGGGLAGSAAGNKFFKSVNNIIDEAGRAGANATAYVGSKRLSDNFSEIKDAISDTWSNTTNYFSTLFNNDEEEDEEEKRKKRLLGLL